MSKLGANPPPKSNKPSYPRQGTKDNSNLENIFAKNKEEVNMNNIHKTCITVRGIKTFKCLICDKESTNYSNGIMVCDDCCSKKGICRICGEPMNDKEVECLDKKKLIKFLDGNIKYLNNSINEAQGDYEFADNIGTQIITFTKLENLKERKRVYEELRNVIENNLIK